MRWPEPWLMTNSWPSVLIGDDPMFCNVLRIVFTLFFFHINMCSRYLRWPEPWLMTHSWPSVFLKGKVLTYSPQLPYWDIRVSQTTFTQLGQLWRTEQIMPAPRRSPIQLLTQSSVALLLRSYGIRCIQHSMALWVQSCFFYFWNQGNLEDGGCLHGFSEIQLYDSMPQAPSPPLMHMMKL